jgi:hypothetical protein
VVIPVNFGYLPGGETHTIGPTLAVFGYRLDPVTVLSTWLWRPSYSADH